MPFSQVPDNINRVFVLIGAILCGFGFLNSEKQRKVYFDQIDARTITNDSLKRAKSNLDFTVDRLKQKSEDISLKYDVKNPIAFTDSTIIFTKTLSGNKNSVVVTDVLSAEFEKYLMEKQKVQLALISLETQEAIIEAEKDEMESNDELMIPLCLTGLLFFFVGLLGLSRSNDIDEEIKKQQLLSTERIYKYCQSCGKLFNSVIKKSTNRDGSINNAYCDSCFREGEYVDSSLSLEELVKRDIAENPALGRIKKAILRWRLRSSERWKSNHYF